MNDGNVYYFTSIETRTHACDTIMLVNTLMSVRREFELF